MSYSQEEADLLKENESLRAQVAALQERVKELEENERLGVLKFDALKFPTRQRMREEISRLRADLARVTGELKAIKGEVALDEMTHEERGWNYSYELGKDLAAERAKNAALLSDLAYMAYLVEDWKESAKLNLFELKAEREKNAALTAECKKQWRLRMTGSACGVCGGQGRISRAAIKLPETYEDCPSCAIDRGPWAWLSDRLTVEDFQRMAKQHGDVVIRVREEGREAERARAKGMEEALSRVLDCIAERKLEICIDCVKIASTALSPSPAKEPPCCDGMGCPNCGDAAPAVEKPCRFCGGFIPFCPKCPPAVEKPQQEKS